jgi:CubicO group peptidase (beta-lactamase class C family)
MTVTGTVASGFEPVREVFEENFRSRGEVGAGVAVMVGDEVVVDLHGGVTEPGGDPYDASTLQMVASCTKGAMAILILRLVDQGLIDLDQPMVAYWPEFGANGKESVTVRQALAHRAGIPYFDGGLTLEEMIAWDPAVAKVIAQAPIWEPDSDHGYHAITHAWIVGELIRQVTGMSPGAFLQQEISQPLGIDLWVGLPASELGRVAPLIPPLPPATPDDFSVLMMTPGTNAFRAFCTGDGLFSWLNIHEQWQAELPAGNGMGNALALAKMYAACLTEVDGIRLVSPETLADGVRTQSKGFDQVLGFDSHFGTGFMLTSEYRPMSGSGAFGHPGLGGSLGFGDIERGFSFGYTVNQMGPSTPADPRSVALIDAVLACL